MVTALSPLLGHDWMALTGEKQQAKERLARHLVSRYRPAGDKTPPQMVLTSDGKGCPLLSGPNAGDLRISFSTCEGVLWAALAAGAAVGIDVESPEAFTPPYPFGRVFSREEQRCINTFDEDRPQLFAAALWACKEAAVKARGTGFSDLTPLAVTVDLMTRTGKGYLARVRAETTYLARVQPHNKLWLAIACPEP